MKTEITKRRDFWSSLFWILFSLLAIKLASRLPLGSLYEPGPGLFPLLLSLIILGFAFIFFLQTLLMPKAEQPRISLKWMKSALKVLPVLILLFLYAVFLETLGFLTVTFLLILLLLWAIYHRKWWVSLTTALAGSFGAYLIFQVWLQSQLPRGIFGF